MSEGLTLEFHHIITVMILLPWNIKSFLETCWLKYFTAIQLHIFQWKTE